MPGEFYIEGKKGKLGISSILAGVTQLENKLDSLVVYRGVTTDAGAIDGSTMLCSGLAERPDYDGNQVVITSGGYTGQARDIDGATTGGIVTPCAAFGGRIIESTEFAILGIRTTPAEVAALRAVADAIKAQTDKLTGESPGQGSATANWNTAESNVVSIGADGTRYKVHSLLLGIHNLAGTAIVVRMYMEMNGTERKVYEQVFDATVDPLGSWIINGTLGIHEVLRVTLRSNNAADDGKAVDYDYMLEAM